MKPYWSNGVVSVHHGACEDILPQLEAESVDCIITDPPYNIGKDFGNGAKADRRDGQGEADRCGRG